MMIRQECTDDCRKIGIYCNFLEYKANEYEYISFIMNDEKMIDYYTMEDDETDTTFIVYFHIPEDQIDKIHNIKVVAKLIGADEFEVGTLYVNTETYDAYKTDKEVVLDVNKTSTSGTAIPKDIEHIKYQKPALEVVNLG